MDEATSPLAPRNSRTRSLVHHTSAENARQKFATALSSGRVEPQARRGQDRFQLLFLRSGPCYLFMDLNNLAAVARWLASPQPSRVRGEAGPVFVNRIGQRLGIHRDRRQKGGCRALAFGNLGALCRLLWRRGVRFLGEPDQRVKLRIGGRLGRIGQEFLLGAAGVDSGDLT